MQSPYIDRVVIRCEAAGPEPGGHVLTGSPSDLRTVLEELLAAVRRIEASPNQRGFHGVLVGDGSSRWEFTSIAVRADPDVQRYRARTRRLWRFYDSQLAGGVALIVFLLVLVGAHTVWQWIVTR